MTKPIPYKITLKGKIIDLSSCKIMSIINVTPDSFYEGSRVTSFDSMRRRIEDDLLNGADIFDIGGYSSRPGAENISQQLESERVVTAVEVIRREFGDIPLSIDTFRGGVVKDVIEIGGDVIVNDISAAEIDPSILDVVAKHNLPYIAMHMRGTPQNMQNNCTYNDIVNDLITYFYKKLESLHQKGVEQVILDLGFGFSKSIEQNFELLSRLEEFQILGAPQLVGISRKSMIYKSLNIEPQEALNGTTVLNTIALMKGANILRVHDVKEAKEAIKLVELHSLKGS